MVVAAVVLLVMAQAASESQPLTFDCRVAPDLPISYGNLGLLKGVVHVFVFSRNDQGARQNIVNVIRRAEALLKFVETPADADVVLSFETFASINGQHHYQAVGGSGRACVYRRASAGACALVTVFRSQRVETEIGRSFAEAFIADYRKIRASN